MKHLCAILIMVGSIIGCVLVLAAINFVGCKVWEPFKQKHRKRKWFKVCGKISNAISIVIGWAILLLIVAVAYISIYSEL